MAQTGGGLPGTISQQGMNSHGIAFWEGNTGGAIEREEECAPRDNGKSSKMARQRARRRKEKTSKDVSNEEEQAAQQEPTAPNASTGRYPKRSRG